MQLARGLRFSPYPETTGLFRSGWGRKGGQASLVSPFKAENRERIRRGKMPKLSGASPVSNSLCNRHRNLVTA